MTTDSHEERRSMILMGLLALWVAAWGYSVFVLATAPAPAGETVRGLNRASGFLGWQGVAGMIAFACWGIGWSFPKKSGIRRISAVPLGMALALVVAVVGMAMFGG